MGIFAPLLGFLAGVPDPRRRGQGQKYKLPHVLLFSVRECHKVGDHAAIASDATQVETVSNKLHPVQNEPL